MTLMPDDDWNDEYDPADEDPDDDYERAIEENPTGLMGEDDQ